MTNSDEEKVIYTVGEFESLIKNGYELTNVNYKYPPGKLTVELHKDNDRLVAVGNPIYEHILHYKSLYDFEKKRNSFVYVTDTAVYFKFESTILPMIIPGNRIKPICVRRINSSNNCVLYENMFKWTKEMSYKKFTITTHEIFSFVYILLEKNGVVSKKVIGKETFSMSEMNQLLDDSQSYDNAFALSYFLLGNKPPKLNDQLNDTLIGIVIYDLKSKETLAFNVQSMVSFMREHEFNSNKGFYDIVQHLLNVTVNDKLEFMSYPPLPIDSPWYTVLPWISYSVLLPIKLDANNKSKKNMTIPEFFTFGFNLLPVKLNTFAYRSFSAEGRGRATCILNFNDAEQITVNLRFDQSLAQPLIHLDFSYYEKNSEVKLIGHKPLDFQDIYNFSFELFGTMMFAGLFDGKFTTLIKGGIKGIKELAKRNLALLYPVYFIHILERLTQQLDEKGYSILEKLLNGLDIDDSEKNHINKMNIGQFKIINEKDGDVGLTLYGYSIIARYKRGHYNIRIT